MPAHARKDIVRDGEVATYHTWSRCVQRAWLCGVDPLTGVDHSHRKDWIEKLLKYQTQVFAVDAGAFHVLSNHLHGTFCTRPDIADTWSEEEIAWRWRMAWPRWEDHEWICTPADQEIEELLGRGTEHIEKLRCNLSRISWLLARWKEPIARLANAESGTSGHMWAERFGSRELTNDGEVLVGLLYNDMQQVACGAAASLESSRHASIQLRLRAWAAQQAAEAVEAFHGHDHDGSYQLDPAVVEEMLVASWLTPYHGESPLLRMRVDEEAEQSQDDLARPRSANAIILPAHVLGDEATSEAAEPAASEPSDEAPCGETPSADDCELSASDSCRRRSGKTYRIHETNRHRLRRRAAQRRPMLEIFFPDYLEILRQLEAKWKVTRRYDPLIDESAPPRASPDATEASWRRSFAEFRSYIVKEAAKLPSRLLALLRARGEPDE